MFKFTFSKPRHAEAELRALRPSEIVALVDFTQLEVLPGEFIDEELRGSQSDLLIKLPLRGEGESESVFVHLIFEMLGAGHQHPVMQRGTGNTR